MKQQNLNPNSNSGANFDENKISKQDQALLDYAGAILVEDAAQELDAIKAKADTMDIDINRFVDAKNQGIAKLMAKKQKARRRARIRRIASIAAIIVVALTLTFAGLNKYSIAFRNAVNNLFYDENDQSFDFEVDNVGSVPNNWTGYYAPMKTPREFYVVNAQKGEFIQKINYEDSEGHYIRFAVVDKFGFSLDDESGVKETIQINGSGGVWIQKVTEQDTVNTLIWYEGADVLKLYSNLSKDALFDIANSVQIVQ